MDFWKGFHLYFKNEYKPHEVIFASYEALQKNTISELTRILHFLGYQIPEENIFQS